MCVVTRRKGVISQNPMILIFCFSKSGPHCDSNIDECSSDPCSRNSTCLDTIGAYKCVCPEGFTGKSCDENINDCENVTCNDRGTCQDEVDMYR